MLEKRGGVLESARALSRIMKEEKIRGAVIGGVAVVLHGHVRTTRDVDLLIDQSLDEVKEILERADVRFDSVDREFICNGVPVPLVTTELAGARPARYVQIEGITTVRLEDLISMKLHSGTRSITRAQDIADVIGLIRQNKLKGAFAAKVARPVRAEFRKLLKAVKSEPDR